MWRWLKGKIESLRHQATAVQPYKQAPENPQQQSMQEIGVLN
ncbi:hypothetical protein RK21_01027 [Pseudomonas plecoglossicida]|nr:hypothetical protein RK21_01027 [Pseudomonas plecoglossicida]